MNTAQAQAALAEREARERAYQERIRMISMDPIDGRNVAAARRLVREFEHDIPRRYDVVREVRTLASYSHDEDMGVTTFELDFGGTTIRHRLTDQEILMGGVQDVGRFLDILERREICERYCYPVQHPRRWEEKAIQLGDPRPDPFRQPMTATEARARQSEHFAGMRADIMAFDEGNSLTIEQIRRAMEAMQGHVMFPAWSQGSSKERQAAEQKAKDLFILVAGREAFDILESGRDGGIPVKGSAGGEYRLLKKASFCVHRPKDAADLCAVVPGVPLWDHLLGIKLMIEHDEPRFLKTANVSGGRMYGGVAGAQMDIRPGAITWVNPEAVAQQRSVFERMWLEVADRLVHPPIILGIDPAREEDETAFLRARL